MVATETKAKAKLKAAQSRSGSKTVQTPGTKPPEYEDVIGTTPDSNKFREAVKKDGDKSVSGYGEKDYQESYAEAYAVVRHHNADPAEADPAGHLRLLLEARLPQATP